MPARVLTDTCDAARTTNRQPACGTPSKARQAPLIGGWLCSVRRPRHVPLPAEVLARVSKDILNRVPGINRVLYDVSTKPPAGIEWE